MLTDKIIVVTGGSGLLGRSIINKVLENNGIAINADITCKSDLEHNEIYCDITSESSIKNVIETLIGKFGKIDGWINNAYPRTSDWGNSVETLAFESWRQNVDKHLNGYFLCCQQILNLMKSQRFGSVINMASIYGMQGPDFTVYEGTNITNPVAYSAIKGGIVNLTRYLASYYGSFNVRVNTISPGGIFDNQEEKFVINYCKKTPLKRMGTPEDISPSVAFLLSDAASYITGHNLVIDGGWTIV